MRTQIRLVFRLIALLTLILSQARPGQAVASTPARYVDAAVAQTENGPRALATVMDYATPRHEHAGYAFRYGVPTYDQQRRYNVPLRLSLPDYLYDTLSQAYLIDPWLGVQALPLQKITAPTDGSSWEAGLTLPELNIGALLVLGDAADGELLAERWAEVAPHFAAYDDLKPAVLSRAREHPTAPWHAPDTVYRQTITPWAHPPMAACGPSPGTASGSSPAPAIFGSPPAAHRRSSGRGPRSAATHGSFGSVPMELTWPPGVRMAPSPYSTTRGLCCGRKMTAVAT